LLYFRSLPKFDFIFLLLKSFFYKNFYKNNRLIIDNGLFATNGLTFSKSRDSFNFIVKELASVKKKKFKILFPEFFCYEVLEYFDLKLIDLIFYPINIDLKPNLDSILKLLEEYSDIDAIYIVDFFGIVNDLEFFRTQKNKYNLYLFFDKSHIIFPNHKLLDNEFLFLSFYKHIAISEGAGVYFNNIYFSSNTKFLLNKILIENYNNLNINHFKKYKDLLWTFKSFFVIISKKITYAPNYYFDKKIINKVHGQPIVYNKGLTSFTINSINQFYSNTESKKASIDQTYQFYISVYQLINKKFKCSAINYELKNSHLFSIKFPSSLDSNLVLTKLQNCKLPVIAWPERQYVNRYHDDISIENVKNYIDSILHLCVFASNEISSTKKNEILLKLENEFNYQ